MAHLGKPASLIPASVFLDSSLFVRILVGPPAFPLSTEMTVHDGVKVDGKEHRGKDVGLVITEFGQVVGTFEYMSPEQAELTVSRRD